MQEEFALFRYLYFFPLIAPICWDSNDIIDIKKKMGT